MALSLYETCSCKTGPVSAADGGELRLYVCGPTVYDFAHVGHARCYVIYDVLVRHLRASGQKVRYVRNVTDVDDKILKRAEEKGEPPSALAERFFTEFTADMASLGNLRPDVEPKVTEHLPEIVALIERLIASGSAYVAGRDVYFSVPSFAPYGQLSHRTADALAQGASGRISDEEQAVKRHPADFALWKSADEGAWGWPSPWGHGRPGWHIECSAMSMKHLGETVDLHGGGLDLVFPHHENEIAQSEAATKKPFVRHWMHNGFVEVNKEKMGKSLGNFFTARDIFARYEPEAVRWGMLTVHYRSPLNFDWTLDEAGHVVGFPLFEETERKVEYLYTTHERLASIDPARVVAEGAIPEPIAKFPAALSAALDDDLNFPISIALAGEMLAQVNELVETTKRKKGTAARAAVDAAKAALAALATELGLGAQDAVTVLRRIRDRRAKARGIVEADVEAKIADRKAAREAKDFARADAVRAELTALGVELMDGPTGTTWRIP
jgi:cysteinyl-tRNA synthetase